MSVTKSAASLQKAYLQAANSFAAYNFKEYFVRQANIRFASPPAEGSANYQSWVKSAERDIAQLQRCAFTNTMYEAPRLVVEDKGQKMMQGGGGAGVEAAAGGAGQPVNPEENSEAEKNKQAKNLT